jgi:hypothetical protein
MISTQKRRVIEKLAGSALRSRLLVKKNLRSDGGWGYSLFVKTKKGPGGEEFAGTIQVTPHGMVRWSKLEDKFRSMGLGKAFYSRVLQHQHKVSPKKKFPLFGDSFQSGFAHQIWSGLGRGPKTSGAKKVKGAKQDVREVRTGQIPLTPGSLVTPRLTKGTLPIVLHRPGSKRAKEQAKRFIAQGRPQSEWTTTEQIKRWKRAKDMKADERGLAPPRFVGKSPSRKAPHIKVKARSKTSRSFAKAQREGEMIRGLNDEYASGTDDAKKIQGLQKALPKDSPFLFGTLFGKKNKQAKRLSREERKHADRILDKVKYRVKLDPRDLKFVDSLNKDAESYAKKKGKRVYRTMVEPGSRKLMAKVWEPAYQGRITKKKMRKADHTNPSRKYGRTQKPHGKRKAERPARDHTKGFDLKDRSTWYTSER